MDAKQLAEIKARYETAGISRFWEDIPDVIESLVNEDIPALVAEVERLKESKNIIASGKYAPVLHGRWVTNSEYPDTILCSVCGCGEDVWWADNGTSHCPYCGAIMDGKEPTHE